MNQNICYYRSKCFCTTWLFIQDAHQDLFSLFLGNLKISALAWEDVLQEHKALRLRCSPVRMHTQRWPIQTGKPRVPSVKEPKD